MAKRQSKQPKRDIYQEITDRIVERIEQGDLPPWRQPIKNAGSDDPFPKNLATGKAYRGINIWMLSISSWCEGYGSNHWMTFRQAKEKGGQVRKGEHGTLVTFWSEYKKKDKESGEEVRLPVLKHYTVFNVDQIDGVEDPAPIETDAAPFTPNEKAQAIVDGYAGAPSIEHRGNRAYYAPSEDRIVIAPPESFHAPEEYYGTLYHELTHYAAARIMPRCVFASLNHRRFGS